MELARPLLPYLATPLRRLLGSKALSSVRRHYRGVATCLLYHRIVDNHDIGSLAGISVHRDAFAEQLEYFAANFSCISLADLANMIQAGVAPPRDALIVTFDDGYCDNLDHALPLLEKFAIPVTIFVTTGLIDAKASPWWLHLDAIARKATTTPIAVDNEFFALKNSDNSLNLAGVFALATKLKGLSHNDCDRVIQSLNVETSDNGPSDPVLLTWDELRALDKHPLVTIGSHTINHPSLRSLADATAHHEILEGKRRLDLELGHSTTLFAYPYGDSVHVGQREVLLAQEIGFALACTTTYGHIMPKHYHGADRFAIPRVSITYDDTIEHVISKVSGVEAMIRNNFLRSPRISVDSTTEKLSV